MCLRNIERAAFVQPVHAALELIRRRFCSSVGRKISISLSFRSGTHDAYQCHARSSQVWRHDNAQMYDSRDRDRFIKILSHPCAQLQPLKTERMSPWNYHTLCIVNCEMNHIAPHPAPIPHPHRVHLHNAAFADARITSVPARIMLHNLSRQPCGIIIYTHAAITPRTTTRPH